MAVVLTYAGTRRDTLALTWLVQQWRDDVVTVTVDIGQPQALEDVRERALALGAARAHVIDGRDRFVREYLWPSLSAGAMNEAPWLDEALASAAVARTLVETAELEGADTVAHATPAATAARVERLLRALSPELAVIDVPASWRTSEEEVCARAAASGIPAAWLAEAPVRPGTLWARPAVVEAPERSSVSMAPAARVRIAFDRGRPVGLNGVLLDPVDLVAALETTARAHGVGRFITSDDAGQAVEAPAALVLTMAHAAVQREALPAALDELAVELGRRYAALVRAGDWHGLTRHVLEGFVDRAQAFVNGDVAVALADGRCEIRGVDAVPAPCGMPLSLGKDS